MRKGTLFASILAGIAALAGSVNTSPEPTPQQYAAMQNSDAQVTGTRSQSPAPVANVTSELVRAGATVVEIPVRYSANPRWAWVGRKVNGRFGYYCRRVA